MGLAPQEKAHIDVAVEGHIELSHHLSTYFQ